MPGPEQKRPDRKTIGVIGKPRQPEYPWSAYSPLRQDKKTGVPAFASREHFNAYNSTRPEVARWNKLGHGIGMLGQAPALASNILELMAKPQHEYGLNEYSKQFQIEKALSHLSLDQLQNILVPNVWANMGIDTLYQANYPWIDEKMNHFLINKHNAQKKLGSGDDITQMLAKYLSTDQSGRAVKPFVDAQLPPILKGYRGHVMANAFTKNGKPNYGNTWLDLFRDVAMPGNFIAPYVASFGTAPLINEFNLRRGHPDYYLNDDDSVRLVAGKPKPMTFKSGVKDAWNTHGSNIIKDLNASIIGLGKNTSQGLQFIP